MAFASLRDFIDRLEQEGRLVRVSEAVSPNLEMTEIQTRLLAEGGPAVLFENVIKDDGQPFGMPVLVNLFGTVERVAWGMSREPGELREIGETLAMLRQPEPPESWKDAAKALPLVKTIMSMKPKTVKKAPCQDVVLTGGDIDLSLLPVQTCWPGEPAPVITWPLVVTRGPEADKKGGDTRDMSSRCGRAEVIWYVVPFKVTALNWVGRSHQRCCRYIHAVRRHQVRLPAHRWLHEARAIHIK